MKINPFWLELLVKWQSIEGSHGLSLPFIVGADAIRRGTLATGDDTKQILGEISSHKIPGITIDVAMCPGLKVPIFVCKDFAGKAFQNHCGGEGPAGLAVLESDAEIPVREGKFSRIEGYPFPTWEKIPPHEQEFIEAVIRDY